MRADVCALGAPRPTDRRVKIEIKHGRVVDPKHGVDRVTSLYVAAGTIAAIGAAPAGWRADRTIEARGTGRLPGA